MLPIPMTIPTDWKPLPGIMLEQVVTRTGTVTHRLAPALDRAVQSGRIEIEQRKPGRKSTGIFWRKARPSLFG